MEKDHEKLLDIYKDREQIVALIAGYETDLVRFLSDYTTKTHTELLALYERTQKYQRKLKEMGKDCAKAINFATDIWRMNKRLLKCAKNIQIQEIYDFPEYKEQRDIVTKVTHENLSLCEKSMASALQTLAELFILYSAEDCKRNEPYECWFADDNGATNYSSKKVLDDGAF